MHQEPGLDAFSTIADGLYLEGLAIDHERDLIWYSDVAGGGIHAVRPDGTKVASLNEERKWTGGVLVNRDGILLSSGQHGIMWNDPEAGTSGWLVDRIFGHPVNGINEMIPDGTGGLFFGTLDIENVIAGAATRPTELYHLSRDRELTRVAEGIGFANGLMFDEEAGRLYCNDTFCGTWAFDLAPDGSLGNRRLLLDKKDADGMALDMAGNLWITGFCSGFFTRVTPAGERLGDVATCAVAITQVRFGGVDGQDCYFTSVPADGGAALKEGAAISARKSFLYKARSTVPGRKIAPTQFELG